MSSVQILFGSLSMLVILLFRDFDHCLGILVLFLVDIWSAHLTLEFLIGFEAYAVFVRYAVLVRYAVFVRLYVLTLRVFGVLLYAS